MSEWRWTRLELLAKTLERYARAGKAHKARVLDELVDLLGFHRTDPPAAAPPPSPPFVLGRPRDHEPWRILPVLKSIWFAAWQPCGSPRAALLPEWLSAYEADHRRSEFPAVWEHPGAGLSACPSGTGGLPSSLPIRTRL